MTIIRKTESKKLVITSGRMLGVVLQSEKYKDYTIIDPFFIKPLDLEILEHIKDANNTEIIEESSIGGLASIILEECHKHNIDAKNIKIQTLPDQFIHHGSNNILRQKIFKI